MEEVLMPWTPEVFTAPYPKLDAPRVRRAPTMPAYYEGILAGQPNALVRSFAGQPRVNDPRVGHVEGVRELRAFVSRTADWLRERGAVVENVALTRTQTRTVEAVVLQPLGDEGGRGELPAAIVTNRHPDSRNFNRRHWKPVQKSVGIEPLRDLYDLRHTYATFARRASVPVFALSRFMGTSIAMIDLHYGHLAVDSHQHAVSLLDALALERAVDAGWRWTPARRPAKPHHDTVSRRRRSHSRRAVDAGWTSMSEALLRVLSEEAD